MNSVKSKLKDVVIPLEEIAARVVVVSDEIKTAMGDPERDNKAVAVCAEHGITDPEDVDIVGQTLGLVFLGMIKLDELAPELNAFLDLNDVGRAERLAGALRKEVFAGIEEEVAKYYMPLPAGGAEEPVESEHSAPIPPVDGLPTSSIPLTVPGVPLPSPVVEVPKAVAPAIPPPPTVIKVSADIAPVKAPPAPIRVSGVSGTLIGPSSAPRPATPPIAPARLEFGKVQSSAPKPPAAPGRVRTPDAPPPPRVVNYGP